MSGLVSKIMGYLSGNFAEVDANHNLQVVTPIDITKAGFVLNGGIKPAVSSDLIQYHLSDISAEGRTHVAVDRPVFYLNFAGSATAANAIPQDALKQTATTMTASAGSTAGGFLWLNSGSDATTAKGIQYQTYGTFPSYGGYETRYEFQAMPINCNTAVNKVLELGAGLTTDAKTDGLLDGFCFRWTKSGTFIGVISIAGTEYQTPGLAVPSDNVLHRFTINVTQLGCEFYVDQVLQAILTIPVGAVGPCYNTNPPMLMRIYNAVAVPSLAPQVKIAEIWVSQAGIDWQKPWPHIIAGMGQNCCNVPFGQAMAAGSSMTSNRGGTSGGAAVPATAVGSNTAILTGCATLGGIGRMTAQATNINAGGDNIFFSYQVPAQSATQASKRLVITGLSISASNGGAVVAGTNTTLHWSLAWGNTAVSMATADTVSAKGVRFMSLGQMTVPVGAVIGQTYDRDIVRQFVTPVVVNPGEYINVTVRFLVGTATSLQEVVAAVGFEGYWE
jgi:hypothetical protein